MTTTEAAEVVKKAMALGSNDSVMIELSSPGMVTTTMVLETMNLVLSKTRNGLKLEAIKLYRELTNCSLVEAKNFVDRL